MKYRTTLTAVCLALSAAIVSAADWKPAESTLMTRWAKDVDPQQPHPEYPRPQLVRGNWMNLNGLWDYAIVGREAAEPESFDGQILVPFAVESALSGVKRTVTPEQRLWYRRTFEIPAFAAGQRLLLHFQAVDWHAQVWVNGKMAGEHQGGYDPFSFDITGLLNNAGPQTLVVAVWDPTNRGPQPRGKQVLDPNGIWYTAVTGIWQTVWLEAVPENHVQSLHLVPDVDAGELHVTVTTPAAAKVWAQAIDGDIQFPAVTGQSGTTLKLTIPDMKLWSPDRPFLYELKVGVEGGEEVASYFGMRKIEIKKDDAGINRIWLNGKVDFQIGPLDQGWWPDGLYTAPTDAALAYDVQITKDLGYNMARKHVKVEPARWYYHCDRLGLLVWQDMPSGNGAGPRIGDGQSFPRSQFELELQRMIDAFRNHPSIVMWVPFNEGWGQHDTPEVVAAVKQYDPTRLVNEASGWTNFGSGDVRDIHAYPGPAIPPLEDERAAVLGEFGGLGIPIEGHLWWDKRNWGYRNFTNLDELQAGYDALIVRLKPLIARGLCAAVYTQTSDVEGEVNGLLTYDRAVVKFNVDHMARLHAPLYLPPPVIVTRVVVPTSQQQPQIWRYALDKPADDWHQPDFDDSSWKQGPGGFGEPSTPGAVVRTPWKTENIWLRRTFELTETEVTSLHLRIHHDEDAVVYLNGKQIASYEGFLTDYEDLPLDARAALRIGKNTLAIHCRQTRGGQYIDAGLVDLIEKERPTE
jgi:hypothetical protein